MSGATRLRSWRQKQKKPQREIAAALEVDGAIVSHWECGHRRPGLVYALAIEKLTGGVVKPEHWVDSDG
jgi:transcriptional regulator with XRE-family HTH domain